MFASTSSQTKNKNASQRGESVARAAFAGSAALLAYTAIGYPLLVAGLSRLRPRPVAKAMVESDAELPGVTMIIAAYNEEAAIRSKIDNSLALDYPQDKLEIIVVSDCSSDATDEIVCNHPQNGEDWGEVYLHRMAKRGGKTAAQNEAALRARGEILLFSDATSDYDADVLRTIIPNFADPQVGCVAGRLIYVDPAKSGVGQGARSYWGYEIALKQSESRLFSLIGVSGCLYAVRRSAYRALPADASSDFSIAGDMVAQNLRAVLEMDAICREETNRRVGKELKMRTRIMTQTYRDLWRLRSLMNPRKTGFYAVQLWSHKVCRYFAPLFLLVGSAASLRLASRSKFHRYLVAAQGAILLAAALGTALERRNGRQNPLPKILALPRYFLLSNAAPLMALWKVLSGERYAQWETGREMPDSQTPGQKVPTGTIAGPTAPAPDASVNGETSLDAAQPAPTWTSDRSEPVLNLASTSPLQAATAKQP